MLIDKDAHEIAAQLILEIAKQIVDSTKLS